MQSKERIKDRILRRAARLWGYNDSEFETAFDPLVALLLETVASELEKLSSELYSSESRITERMLEMMSPVANAGSMPAMSVIHATPSENNFTLSAESLLYCQKTIPDISDPRNASVKEIWFGPTAPFILATAEIRYMALGNALYTLSTSSYKEVYQRTDSRLFPARLWLGIAGLTPGSRLKKLMFYTDIKERHQKAFFYHYLSQANLYLGEKRLPFEMGYNVAAEELDIDGAVTRNHNRLKQICRDANRYYQDQFFHLTRDLDTGEEDFVLPAELVTAFGPEKLNNLKDIVWLRMDFPEAMSNAVLENTVFSLNCFPAINKQMISVNQAIDPLINYIPLASRDHFLDIEYITDSAGHSYHIRDFSETGPERGEAVLRSSGVMRFDERNASELIQYLLELLKDESAAFSVVGGDFIKKNIEKMRQLIAVLEQQTREKRFIQSGTPYVMVKPGKAALNRNDMVYVRFWSTCGEEANGLQPGTRLRPPSGTDFRQDSAYLVTASAGGKTRYSMQEKIRSYRSALLSHGRIVTMADIRSFALDHFKNAITGVAIKRGTKKEIAVKSGVTRTIDIIIARKDPDEQEIPPSEWAYLCGSFKTKLQQMTSGAYPYRLISDGEEM